MTRITGTVSAGLALCTLTTGGVTKWQGYATVGGAFSEPFDPPLDMDPGQDATLTVAAPGAANFATASLQAMLAG